jgi:hypothetical protein
MGCYPFDIPQEKLSLPNVSFNLLFCILGLESILHGIYEELNFGACGAYLSVLPEKNNSRKLVFFP